MWDHIGKARYIFPSGIEKFKSSSHHMQKKKEREREKKTLLKDPGDGVYKRPKSFM
jgi:hypothetical protein